MPTTRNARPNQSGRLLRLGSAAIVDEDVISWSRWADGTYTVTGAGADNPYGIPASPETRSPAHGR